MFGEIKEPLSRNLYIYGNGNPLKYVDPSGHENKIKNNLDGGGRDEVDIRCNSGAPDNPLKKFFNWIKNGLKSLVGKPNLPIPNGSEINSSTKGGPEFGRNFTAPKITVNKHGQLTNGKYTFDSKGMDPHICGKTSTGKSWFLY